jgi:hypothetical protein
MARDLTTPTAKPSVYHQAITHVAFRFPTEVLAGPPVEVNLVRQRIAIVFEVTNYAADGTVIERIRATGNFPDWPAAFTTDVSSVYAKLEAYAESLGIMQVGTSEDL